MSQIAPVPGAFSPSLPYFSSGHQERVPEACDGQVQGDSVHRQVLGALDFSSRLIFPLHGIVYILLTCFQLLIAELFSLSALASFLYYVALQKLLEELSDTPSLDSLTSHL